MNLQRPNQVKIERRALGALSPTNEPTESVQTLNTNVPARLQTRRRADVAPFTIAGITYVQDALLIIDGIGPAQFTGKISGETVTISGITFTVAPNLLSAWPDINQTDRVTDEYGQKYLVLAVSRFDLTHTLQAMLASGRSW